MVGVMELLAPRNRVKAAARDRTFFCMFPFGRATCLTSNIPMCLTSCLHSQSH